MEQSEGRTADLVPPTQAAIGEFQLKTRISQGYHLGLGMANLAEDPKHGDRMMAKTEWRHLFFL